MKTLCAALAASFLLAAPASAALPPYYDSGRQIEAILGSGEIAEAVRIAPIEGLERLGETAEGEIEWRLRTRDCSLTVAIRAIPLPSGMVGAVNYELARVGACE